MGGPIVCSVSSMRSAEFGARAQGLQSHPPSPPLRRGGATVCLESEVSGLMARREGDQEASSDQEGRIVGDCRISGWRQVIERHRVIERSDRLGAAGTGSATPVYN